MSGSNIAHTNTLVLDWGERHDLYSIVDPGGRSASRVGVEDYADMTIVALKAVYEGEGIVFAYDDGTISGHTNSLAGRVLGEELRITYSPPLVGDKARAAAALAFSDGMGRLIKEASFLISAMEAATGRKAISN